jgi:hypothetical protein
MPNIPSKFWLLLAADKNDFQVSGAHLGESRDVAKTSSEATVIKFSGIFMGRSNRFVVAPEISTDECLLTKKALIDGDSMATTGPTDTKPSSATKPPKNKYSPPALTVYGTVQDLTKTVGQNSTPDGGSGGFIKSGI